MLLTVDEIRARLFDRKLAVVSRQSGISRTTLYKIIKGTVPSYDTLVKLSQYLAERK